jgi:tetratricopeptide (TPR) repeat protein
VDAKPFQSSRLLLLAATLSILALALTGRPGLTGPTPTVLFMGGGLLAMLCSLYLIAGVELSFSLASLAVLAVCSGLSQLHSLAPYLTQFGLCSLVTFVGVFFGLSKSIDSRFSWTLAQRGLVLVSTLSAIHGLVLYGKDPKHAALVSTFTNPDCYSLICLVGFFAALGLAAERKSWSRHIATFCCLILVTALTLTAARSGILALGLGYLAFLFVMASSRKRRIKAQVPKLFLLPCIGLLLIAGLGSSQQFSGKWLALLQGRDSVAIKSRSDVWLHSPKSVWRSPLVGHGLGCFSLAYQEDRPPLMAGEDYMNAAHNDYLQWAVEIGLVGLLAWLALLCGAATTAWRSYKSPTPFVASQIGSTVAIAVFCIFNPACPVPACFIWIGASLAMSYSLPKAQDLTENDKRGQLHRAVGGLCLLLCFGSGYWCLQRARSIYAMETKIAQAQILSDKLEWEQAVELLGLAATDYPPSPKPLQQSASLSQKAFSLSRDSQWLKRQENCLLGALQTSPTHLKCLLDVTRYYEDQGQAAKAQPNVDKAAKASPSSPHVRRAKVRNSILQGNLEEATNGLALVGDIGMQIDDNALSEMLILLEARCLKLGQPDTQVRILLDSMDARRRFAVGLLAAKKARQAKMLPEAMAMIKILETDKSQPQDQALVQLIKAQCLGDQGQIDQTFAILDKLLFDKSVDAKLSTSVHQYWTELRFARKEYRLILVRLERYLVNQPQQSWARSQQSRIQLLLGNKSEARAILQAGVPYDNDGSLRLQIGDLCASQGLTSLAGSYYEEAKAYSASIAAAEARIKGLKGKAVEDTETLVD